MASRLRDVRLAKGNSPFVFELSGDGSFDSSNDSFYMFWESGAAPTQSRGVMWEFKPRVDFVAATSGVEFREAFTKVNATGESAGHMVVGKIQFPASKIIQRVFRKDDRGSFTMAWEIRQDQPPPVIDLSLTSASMLQHRDQLLKLAPIKSLNQENKIKFLRITFENADGNRFLKIETIREILEGVYNKSMGDLAAAFVQQQFAALDAEQDAIEQKFKALKRDRCEVRVEVFMRKEKKCAKLYVRSIDKSDWELEIGWKISLVSKAFKAKSFCADADGDNNLTASIIAIRPGGIYIATVNNPLRVSDFKDTNCNEVEVNILERDLLAGRMYNALKVMDDAIRDQLRSEGAASMHVDYTRLFIKHPDNEPVTWPAMPVNLKAGLDKIPYVDTWYLEESHKKVFDTILRGSGGLTGIKGSPGTGKSTLIAKCVAMALKFCDLNGKIVMSAHSNQATQVLLERCHAVFTSYGLSMADHVVLVETAAGVRRRRQFQRTLPNELEAYSLESQMIAVAQTNAVRFHDYLNFHHKVVNGDDLTLLEHALYNTSKNEVMDELHSRKTVFVCTISAINTRFFRRTISGESGGYNCAMWFVDETSQCPLPAFIEGWNFLNPRQIVIGGDYNQLQCFSLSEAARNTWGFSPIYYMERLGEEFCVLLDVQFRMVEHLYQPTSIVHYNGRIKSTLRIRGQDYDSDLSQRLNSIQIDPKGKGEWENLNHNFVLFDVENGRQARFGAHSSINYDEAQLVSRLIKALGSAGVNSEDIMALTPYEGQYQELLAVTNELNATNVSVRKIDSSQGSEKPIVIFSSVKTNSIGFMKSSQRQNVGTSRQQNAFFMFGSLKALGRDSTWRKWLDAVRDSNGGPSNSRYAVNVNCNFRCMLTPHQTSLPPVQALEPFDIEEMPVPARDSTLPEYQE